MSAFIRENTLTHSQREGGRERESRLKRAQTANRKEGPVCRFVIASQMFGSPLDCGAAAQFISQTDKNIYDITYLRP